MVRETYRIVLSLDESIQTYAIDYDVTMEETSFRQNLTAQIVTYIFVNGIMSTYPCAVIKGFEDTDKGRLFCPLTLHPEEQMINGYIFLEDREMTFFTEVANGTNPNEL
jgi:hypothetical protein